MQQNDSRDRPKPYPRQGGRIRAVMMVVLLGAGSLAIGLAWSRGWLGPGPALGLAGILFGLVAILRAAGPRTGDAPSDRDIIAAIRAEIEALGDRVVDIRVWREGPGHLGGMVGIVTAKSRDVDFYRAALTGIAGFSHLTIEVDTAKKV